MTKTEFIDALRGADEAIGKLEPPRRMHAAVAERLHRKTNPLVLLVPALAGAVLIAAIVVLARAPAAQPNGVTFAPPSCAPATPRPELELAAGCTVSTSEPNVDLHALSPAVLRRLERGFVIDRGSVSIDARGEPSPFAVVVSAGRLNVVAARFVVEVTGRSGEVRVEDGRVRFEAVNGTHRTLDAQDEERWSDAKVSAPEEWSAERIDVEVRRATQLRLQGHHRAAAEQLERLLRAPLPKDAASVLSYERATLLDTKLADQNTACDQYRRHRDRFGVDRYAEAVEEALERCKVGNFGRGKE